MKQKTTLWLKHHQVLLLSTASVLALSLPFWRYNMGFLALFALTPLLLLIHLLKIRKTPARKIIRTIWLVGTASLCINLVWILQTQPEKWAGLSGWGAVFGLVLTYLIVVLGFSLQYLLFGWLVSRKNVQIFSPVSYVLLPAIWILAEAGRSLVFSIIAYGQGGSIGMYWNFATLGAALASTPLVYLSRIVGLYGLSALAVVASLTLVHLVCKKSYKPLLGTLFVASALAVLAYALYLPSKTTLELGYVQYPQSFSGYAQDLDIYSQLKRTNSNKSSVVVLPEYSDFFYDANSQDNNNAFKTAQEAAEAIAKPEGLLISSQQVYSGEQKFNMVIAYNVGGEVVEEYAKSFLIPIGEYMPFLFEKTILWVFGDSFAKTFNLQTSITKGQDPRLFALNGLRVGAQACSGANVPELYRQMSAKGADVLTNSASLAMFSSAQSYHAQSKQFARFIAVANARPYVQASAGAYSYIISSSGVFVRESTSLDFLYEQASVEQNSAVTLYTYLGEYLLYIAVFVVIWFFVYVPLLARNKASNSGKKK